MAGTAVDQCEGYDTHTLIWMDRCTGVKEQSPALGREAGTVTCEGRPSPSMAPPQWSFLPKGVWDLQLKPSRLVGCY